MSAARVRWSFLVPLIASALIAGCDRAPAPAVPAATEATAPAAPAAPVAPTAPAAPETPVTVTAADIADRVWTVESSSAVAAGTRYSFLADGTLVIQLGADPAGIGRWRLADGAMVLTEEGIDYPTDIVSFAPGRLELRSHNPGDAVTIVLVPDPSATLPAPPAPAG